MDLKPNIELKPFDKVLIRDFESQAWQVSFLAIKIEILVIVVMVVVGINVFLTSAMNHC